ncbi:nicotinate N-methyltransferase 1-like [Corylus avellana]|uniref:nicotinate N-methyltransferase 1-like n=1 Tax=Corylus avellana TaxID=13451 RepID=UPI00286CF863|nr:nicotinate N-methyltransferase 1-like [Corylus avellana]
MASLDLGSLKGNFDVAVCDNFAVAAVVISDSYGVTHVGGNMFESIPTADAIFMKWILTTWTDDEVKLIMENCYKALPVGGKMIVCEPVLPEKTDESQRTRALLEGDIFVMTIYRAKGKHRTEEEYRQLGHLAGFPHIQAFYIDYVFTVLEFRK